MTDRHTTDTINSDALDALYDQLDAAEKENAELRDSLAHCHEREPRIHAEAELARLREGEEPVTDPLAEATPGQWIWQWNRATLEQRLNVVIALRRESARGLGCFLGGHEERIHDGRHAEMALNEVRHVVADMEATAGARTWAGWLRDAMKRGPAECLLCATGQKTEPDPDPFSYEERKRTGRNAGLLTGDETAALRVDPPGPAATQATEPHTGLVVQPYTENGEQKWVFRCWGTDDGCDGWLSLDHYSEQSATRARDRHVTEEHSNEEQLPTAADRVRTLHRRNENTGECEYCSARDYPTYAVPFPCDTIRALDGQEQPSV